MNDNLFSYLTGLLIPLIQSHDQLQSLTPLSIASLKIQNNHQLISQTYLTKSLYNFLTCKYNVYYWILLILQMIFYYIHICTPSFL